MDDSKVPFTHESSVLNTFPPISESNLGKKAKIGFILGLLSIIVWLLPLIGFPVTIVGIIFSIKGLSSSNRRLAMLGLILSTFGVVATIANAAIGAYMGATGQHTFLNTFFSKEESHIAASPNPLLQEEPYVNIQEGFKIHPQPVGS